LCSINAALLGLPVNENQSPQFLAESVAAKNILELSLELILLKSSNHVEDAL